MEKMIGRGRGNSGSGEGGGQLWANTLLNAKWLSILSAVRGVAESTGVRVFLVGGIVRQAVFSVIRPELAASRAKLLDIDFVVEGDFETFISEIGASLSPERVNRSAFLTAVCDLPGGFSVDFAQCRTETYRHPGALPEVRPASLEIDASRRDFSINAMYLSLNELFRPPPLDFQDLKARIIDYVGGLQALRDGVVEVLHEKSVFDDPTRIFRAVRYRAVLSDFSLEGRFGEKFLSSLKAGYFSDESSPLGAVSHFRKWIELKKCFESGYPAESLRDLFELSIFEHWPPVHSSVRPGFLERVNKLLERDRSLLSEFGFVMFVSIWWWSNLDAASNSVLDVNVRREADERFMRARNELRLNRPIKRSIEERRQSELESISWLREAAKVYFSS